MIIYGASSIGKIRKDNQDSYMFDTLNQSVSYAVVCDGMGGPSGGKTASSTAVSTFASNIIDIADDYSEEKLKIVIDNAIKLANSEIFNKSLKNTNLLGMGTTLVCAVVINETAYFINIGDSRAYIIRDEVIKRISHDHSAVQELVDQGFLTESQARNHPNKNIITRALGVEENIEYDFFKETVHPNDIIVLCTDGITNYIDDLEIPFEILKNNNTETVPQKLIKLANSRGGSDNSTVVIIKV